MHTLSQQLNLFKRGVLVANGLNDLFDGLSCLTSTKQKQESRAVAGNPRDAAVIFDP